MLIYFFVIVVFYVGLVFLVLVMEKLIGNDFFLVVGELKGYESGFKDFVFSDNG